jgi:hypothetical protein
VQSLEQQLQALLQNSQGKDSLQRSALAGIHKHTCQAVVVSRLLPGVALADFVTTLHLHAVDAATAAVQRRMLN